MLTAIYQGFVLYSIVFLISMMFNVDILTEKLENISMSVKLSDVFYNSLKNLQYFIYFLHKKRTVSVLFLAVNT